MRSGSLARTPVCWSIGRGEQRGLGPRLGGVCLDPLEHRPCRALDWFAFADQYHAGHDGESGRHEAAVRRRPRRGRKRRAIVRSSQVSPSQAPSLVPPTRHRTRQLTDRPLPCVLFSMPATSFPALVCPRCAHLGTSASLTRIVPGQRLDCRAVEVGFEPTDELPHHTLSRRAPSATRRHHRRAAYRITTIARASGGRRRTR